LQTHQKAKNNFLALAIKGLSLKLKHARVTAYFQRSQMEHLSTTPPAKQK
jgi:hypothetical protein